MNYILFLAYRKQSIISEVIYSILSYLHRSKECIKEDLKIIIYTDRIDSFQKAFPTVDNIIFENISDCIIDDWLGPSHDVFRPKIKVLQNFFNKYEGNVLFVDSDTCFLKDINPLFEKISHHNFILSLMEKPLQKEFTSPFPPNDFFNYLKGCNKISTNLKTYEIPLDTQCWNSGVIGINSAYAYLLEEILSLTDLINERFEYKYGEQFSFSYIFKNNGVIHSCDDFIFHYWFFKPCRFILAKYFEYFHGDDENELYSVLEQFGVTRLMNVEFPYEDLLPLVFTILIHKADPNSAYLDIPEDSFVGRALRDKKSQMKYWRLLLRSSI